jgi:hypothetical protein
MTDPRNESNKKPGAEQEVPETWQGYLSDRPSDRSPRREPTLPQGDARRDEIERERRERDESASQPRGDAFGTSKAEGVSFAGMVPFFVVMVGLLFGASWYLWSTQIKPKPWDVAQFGAPDKSAEVVARDLFRELAAAAAAGATATMPDDIIINPFDLGRLPNADTDARLLFKKIPTRMQRLAAEVPTGDYVAVNPPPKADSTNEALMIQEYERTDHATGAVTKERLVIARTKAGWRVVGFE